MSSFKKFTLLFLLMLCSDMNTECSIHTYVDTYVCMYLHETTFALLVVVFSLMYFQVVEVSYENVCSSFADTLIRL
jgi:hypothetical protein